MPLRGNNRGSGWSFSGSSSSVQHAISEVEKTNREEINAEKEVKLEGWKLDLAKAKAEREAELANVMKELDVSLAQIKADSDVRMKETTEGLDSEQNFKIQSQGLDNEKSKIDSNCKLHQQSIAANHNENMKKLEIQLARMNRQYDERSEELTSRHNLTLEAMTMDHGETKMAMQLRGKLTLEGMKKGGRGFQLRANALDFRNTRTRDMTKRISSLTFGAKPKQLEYEKNNSNGRPGSNSAIALPGPDGYEDGIDGMEDDNSLFDDDSLFDVDTNLELEDMKIEEMKMEQNKYDQELKMEMLKLEQKKKELDLAKLALLAKQTDDTN